MLYFFLRERDCAHGPSVYQLKILNALMIVIIAKLEQPKQQRQKGAFCLSALLTAASYMCLLAEDGAVRSILDRNINQLLCFFAVGHHLKVKNILVVVFCCLFLADLTSRQLFDDRGV